MAASTAVRNRTTNDITRLVHRTSDLDGLVRALTTTLRRVVPFEGACLLTLDPSTLLPTHEVVDNGLPSALTPRLTEIELTERDFNKFTALARERSPAASLSAATGGELDRSPRQRELRRPSGFADELRIALSDDSATRGALTLLREANRPHFSPAEVRYVASISHVVADGIRRCELLAGAGTPDDPGPGETGIVVLAADDTIEVTNRVADALTEELHDGPSPPDQLPVVFATVAWRARELATSTSPNDARDRHARARVRTRAGRWIVVRGSLVGAPDDGRVAITLERAQAHELAPLVADAYGLTQRERRVTELVARGYATKEIAARLHLSAFTVQDHLKSIFDKTGTASRGDLVARIFFQHYAPRLTVGDEAGRLPEE
jgi:DNA-binding CsgD family transcriptional regulator